jgi:hypothetical protein
VRRKTTIAQLAQRLVRVGEIEEVAGVYSETKIEELAERKLRFDKPELAQEWDKIQRRERQALIPPIESTQSFGQDLGRSLTFSRNGRQIKTKSRVHCRSTRSDAEQGSWWFGSKRIQINLPLAAHTY